MAGGVMLEEEYCPGYRRVFAAINLDAIENNIKAVSKKLTPKTKIMAVIKADAYGHGAVPVAKVLSPLVWGFGVAILEEAVELRKMGIKNPILILGTIVKEQIPETVAYDITTTVFSCELAQAIAYEARKQKKTAKVHIKLDTGMGRIGYQPDEESVAEILEISKIQGLYLEGLFTHFATADEKDKTYAAEQLRIFREFTSRLKKEGISIPIRHAANSAGIIDLPETAFDLVRCGIATYGLYPSDEVNKEELCLVPALEWKTHISYLKQLGPGHKISYGATFHTQHPMRIATIPVGYADGYPRSLSNCGSVLVRGKRAPILGRICMDQFMVDVTEVDGVLPGDEVTLVGRDKDAVLPVEELAQLAGSFNYEFICGIGKRVPRIYYQDQKPFLVRRDCEFFSYETLSQ